MADIIPYPDRNGNRSGGGGPEGPMLEFRVARLEEVMKDVKATLRTIDSKLNSLVESVAEIKGRLAGVEGRMAGLEARISSLPTTGTILTITFTTWALGSGILIFALNVLRR